MADAVDRPLYDPGAEAPFNGPDGEGGPGGGKRSGGTGRERGTYPVCLWLWE